MGLIEILLYSITSILVLGFFLSVPMILKDISKKLDIIIEFLKNNKN